MGSRDDDAVSRAPAARHEDLEQLAGMVTSSDDAIIGARGDGTVWFWNAGAEHLYGHRADAVTGRPVSLASLVVPVERRGEWVAWFDKALGGESVRNQDSVHVHQSGFRISVAVTLSPVRDSAGHVNGVSVVARDITEQKAEVTALEAAVAELEHELSQSRASQVRCQRFLADAAHQLRTPMTGISACAETLLMGPKQDQREKLLANLVRETSRSARLIGDLLQLARLDEGQPLRPSPVDLVGLCRDEMDRTWSLAPHLDMHLGAPDLAYEVQVDGDAVREILANLLDNARRHARSRIDVVVEVHDDAMEVRVADDGPGVADDVVELIFDRFVSVDGMGGSGLGLSIARQLARAHGGDLTYEAGRFVLRLALNASPATGERLGAPEGDRNR